MNWLEGIEITSKFETAEDGNPTIKYILATIGIPNYNGALFTLYEAEKAKDTIINKPLIYIPSHLGLPTGHSSIFPKLSPDALIVGTHIASEIKEIDGKNHIVVTAKLFKTQFPEIIQTMLELHEENDLKFSMECNYMDSEVSRAGVKTMKDITFIASAVVSDPANKYSVSLEAAKRLEAANKINQLNAKSFLDGIEND